MDSLSLIISGFSGAAGLFDGVVVQILQNRLDLLVLEMCEAKIRLVQVFQNFKGVIP